MANYLELDINSGIIQQKNPISVGDAEVAEDTTNAGKIVATNANGKLDNSFLAHDTDIKNLNVSGNLTTQIIDDLSGLNWGFFAKTDFSSGGTDGKGFFPMVNTIGGGFETVAQDPSTLNGCFVFLKLHTSTSSTGASQARGNTGFQLKTSFATYEWGSKVKVPSLSTSTEEFSVQVGIQSSLTSTNALSSRNHIIFHYDRSTYSDDNWRAVTRTSSDSGTVTDTGVSASDSFQKLYFMVDQDNSATRVRFYINGTLVATHTTNIPEDVGLHPRLAILKSVGTTSRAVHLDYMYHRMKFLSHQSRV
jgi:hypothetical protein